VVALKVTVNIMIPSDLILFMFFISKQTNERTVQN